MGLYNQRKLNNLHVQVETVAAHQHWLLQVMALTLHRLDNLEYLMAEMMELLSEDIDITLAERKLQVIRNQLRLQYQQIVRAIQAAQKRRPIVDLLNATRLQGLVHAAQLKAQINKC